LSQNVHPKVVQEILVHCTITLTLDTCSHMLPDLQDAATVKMNDLLVDQITRRCGSIYSVFDALDAIDRISLRS